MAEATSITFTLEDYYDLNETDPYYVNQKTVPCQQNPMELTAALTLCVILIAIFLLAVPGNLLVGWVIGTSKQALTTSDVYLFHLTIADGLMALTLPFFAVAVVWGWLFGDFLCKLVNLVIDANFYTSVIFLIYISIDRYLVIVHAGEVLSSRKRMCSKVLCGAAWALGWALALPALFNEVTEHKERMICTESYDLGSSTIWRLATRGFRHIFGFLVPLSVMLICYSITIVRLLHTRGFQKHRAMKVIIAVVTAFLLCWTPYHITLVVDTLIRADLIHYTCAVRKSVTTALHVTNSLALFHSCINPFLYAFVGEKFRKKMMLLVQRKVRQERITVPKLSRSTSQTSEGTGTLL